MSKLEIKLEIKSSETTISSTCKVNEAVLPTLLAFLANNYKGEDTQGFVNSYWKTLLTGEISTVTEWQKAQVAQSVEEITIS